MFREVAEELNIALQIVRPLWLVQSFFAEDTDRLNYHELGIYFLMDGSVPELLNRGKQFTLCKWHHTHGFEWPAFDRLKDEYFHPLFFKNEIFNLPEFFSFRTEIE